MRNTSALVFQIVPSVTYTVARSARVEKTFGRRAGASPASCGRMRCTRGHVGDVGVLQRRGAGVDVQVAEQAGERLRLEPSRRPVWSAAAAPAASSSGRGISGPKPTST